MTHPAFELIRSQPIESLNIEVQEFRHKKTGAMHYHLAAEQDENVFLVALRTVPTDSTGVAHILEHTALCGSENYPVRDPFFMMLRRSLNTFMNAFTSSDWTAYPFASQNRKDFDNLLKVYLDAVFFSRLDPLDFAQEGHRVEFAEPGNPEAPLVFKGVVFNEMKGAMSSVPSTLWQTICEHLFPTTTYHYNSGGDPEHIPDLSYEQLREFYRTHYHPSNAIFMTFGDIPAEEHQARFEELALSRFEPLDVHIQVPREQRLAAPIRVREHYALGETEAVGNKTHVVLGWLLGESANLDDMLAAQLLTNVLLDNSSSPLQHALETSELGSSPSPLCGLEDSLRELVFVCGLEGCAEGSAEQVEAMILDTLREVAENGVPAEQVEAMLHQLELHQREVGGDGFPYGLQLIIAGLSSATHRGDPIGVLDLDPALARLREAASDPEYIKRLTRTLLLDNSHRVTLEMVPDTSLAQRRQQAETARLAELQSQLSDEQKQAIVQRAGELAARQQQVGDESMLPKVTLDDIPADIRVLQSEDDTVAGMPVTSYAQGTNGLIYQQLFMRLPPLSAELLNILPHYTHMVTELGVGERDYRATQAWQSLVCGSLNAFTAMRGAIDNEQEIDSYLVLSSKALARNAGPQSDLLRATMDSVRFDETGHIRELIAQQRARREASVTQNGHSLAMQAACSGMSPTAELAHNLSGLAGLKKLKALDQDLNDATAAAELAEQMRSLHERVAGAERRLLLVGETETLPGLRAAVAGAWSGAPSATGNERIELPRVRKSVREWWIADTQVNFCARAYPTVPVDHPDAAPLTVLGGFLRNGFLHRAIREQGGAYGGGASQDSNTAAFRFYSYRDPRLEETLADFDAALDWLAGTDHAYEQLEQAILGVIASLDKPASPAGEAKQDFHNRLFGRTPEQRRRFRQRVLGTTVDELRRVAELYLQPELASTAVISNRETRDNSGALLKRLDFEVREL